MWQAFIPSQVELDDQGYSAVYYPPELEVEWLNSQSRWSHNNLIWCSSLSYNQEFQVYELALAEINSWSLLCHFGLHSQIFRHKRWERWKTKMTPVEALSQRESSNIVVSFSWIFLKSGHGLTIIWQWDKNEVRKGTLNPGLLSALNPLIIRLP